MPQIRWSGREYALIPRWHVVLAAALDPPRVAQGPAIPSRPLSRGRAPTVVYTQLPGHTLVLTRGVLGTDMAAPNIKGSQGLPGHTYAGARSCLRMVPSCKTGGADACTPHSSGGM